MASTSLTHSASVGSSASESLQLRVTPGHLIRVAQQVHTTLWRAAFDRAITSVQFGCLIVIGSEPGIDQHTMGMRMSLDKVTGADIVRRLAAGGLVQRVTDTQDRRRRLLRLTAIGELFRRDGVGRVLEVQQRLLEPLRKREGANLVRALTKVLGPLDTSTDVRISSSLSLQQAPGHLIRRAQQRHYTLWQEVVGTELTSVQFGVLLTLVSQPPLSQATLAALVSVDTSSCSEVVARLLKRNLLKRTVHATDGRQQSISVSPAGRRLVTRLTPNVSQVQSQLLQPLPPAGRPMFLHALSRVAFRNDL